MCVTDEDGLLPIGIAAIVIGVVGALILFIVVLFMCCFRNRNSAGCGGDGCCGCWGQNRVVVVRRNQEKPQLRVVQKTPEPQRVIIKEKPRVEQNALVPIYTMPTYLRGNHMRPWMTAEKRQRFVKLNGSLDRASTLQVVPQHRAITMGPSTREVTTNTRAALSVPTAYIQRGGSLRLTTMQEDAVLTTGGTNSNGILRQQSSVLTQADPEPGRYTIIRSTHAESQPSVVMPAPAPAPTPAPAPLPAQITMPAPMPVQTTIPMMPAAIPVTTVYQQQQQPAAFFSAANPTYEINTNFQQPTATYEISGATQQPADLSGASATINVIPGDLSLGQRQSVVLDPYSLVENPTVDRGTVYMQQVGEQNGGYARYI